MILYFLLQVIPCSPSSLFLDLSSKVGPDLYDSDHLSMCGIASLISKESNTIKPLSVACHCASANVLADTLSHDSSPAFNIDAFAPFVSKP